MAGQTASLLLLAGASSLVGHNGTKDGSDMILINYDKVVFAIGIEDDAIGSFHMRQVGFECADEFV